MLLYVTALAVLIADLVTKEIAHRALLQVPGGRVPVIDGFFDFYLQYNPGAAFSLLARYPIVITAFSVVAIVVIFIWSRSIPREAKIAHFSLGLFLGGGVGNLVDRIRFQSVVDFLHFYVRDGHGLREWAFPTFNIADCAITVGIGIFMYLAVFTKKLDKPKEVDVPAEPASGSEDEQVLRSTS